MPSFFWVVVVSKCHIDDRGCESRFTQDLLSVQFTGSEGGREGSARVLKVVCLVVCLYRTVLVLFTLVVGSVLFSAAEEV